eukprot:3681535-Pyramimonas_sp.AAC.1
MKADMLATEMEHVMAEEGQREIQMAIQVRNADYIQGEKEHVQRPPHSPGPRILLGQVAQPLSSRGWRRRPRRSREA